MDLSKLPKFSQTPAPPPPDDRPADPKPYASSAVRLERDSAGPEAWISIAIGLILLLMSPYTLQWLISTISSYQPPFLPITDSQTGAPIPYPQSIFFFGHLCVFAFALVLIIDGLLLLTRNPMLVMIGLLFTVATTLMNFVYVAKATMNGEALPILSALAVAFGIYIAVYQWRLLAALRIARVDAPALVP